MLKLCQIWSVAVPPSWFLHPFEMFPLFFEHFSILWAQKDVPDSPKESPFLVVESSASLLKAVSTPRLSGDSLETCTHCICVLAHSHTPYSCIYFTYAYLAMISHQFIQFPTQHLRIHSSVPDFHIYISFLWQLRNLAPSPSIYLLICLIPSYVANFLTICPPPGLPPCSVVFIWASASARPLLCAAMSNGFLTEFLRQGEEKEGQGRDTKCLKQELAPTLYSSLCCSKFRKAQEDEKRKDVNSPPLGAYK